MDNVKKQYQVNHELFYPTNPAVLRKLKAGENLPLIQRGMKHVVLGEIVDDIPAVSIAGLLEKGWIQEVSDGSAR